MGIETHFWCMLDRRRWITIWVCCLLIFFAMSHALRMRRFGLQILRTHVRCRFLSTRSFSHFEVPTAVQGVGAVGPKVFTSISFFRFMNLSEDVIEKAVMTTKSALHDAGMKGTVLFSPEGYNAQLAIPRDQIEETQQLLSGADSSLFGVVQFNIGQTVDYGAADSPPFPYKKLLVRAKKTILTDGLSEPLDWQDAGPEMDAGVWHRALTSGSETSTAAPEPVVLDCRNRYESEVGTFEGSIPLNTTYFSETWPVLEEILKDTPKDAPVLTYCTGGIRCVKVNAYLQQRLGFTNTHRLQGGIVAYERWLREQSSNTVNKLDSASPSAGTAVASSSLATQSLNGGSQSEQIPKQEGRSGSEEGVKPVRSAFRGRNFVFDRRRLKDELLL